MRMAGTLIQNRFRVLCSLAFSGFGLIRLRAGTLVPRAPIPIRYEVMARMWRYPNGMPDWTHCLCNRVYWEPLLKAAQCIPTLERFAPMPTAPAFGALTLFLITAFLGLATFMFAWVMPPRNWRQFPRLVQAYQNLAPWRLKVPGIILAVTALGALLSGAYAAYLALAVAPTARPATPHDVAEAVTSLTMLVASLLVLIGLLFVMLLRARRAQFRRERASAMSATGAAAEGDTRSELVGTQGH